MASDQTSTLNQASGEEVPEDQPKPSFMKKVKAKAKKLKCKLTQHEAPRTVRQAEEDYSDSSSDGYGETAPIPTFTSRKGSQAKKSPPASTAAKVVPKPEDNVSKAPASAQGNDGSHSTSTADRTFPVDPVVLKNDGPVGTEQAVPTNYSYFNADPALGTSPSGLDTSQRQRDVPSSLGGESAGVIPATEKLSKESKNLSSAQDASLSKSGDFNSELPRSFMASQDVKQKNVPASAEPAQPALGSVLKSQSLEEDSGAVDDADGLSSHNSISFSEWAGDTAPKQASSNAIPTPEFATKDSSNDRSDSSIQGRAYDVKGTLASSLGYTASSASQGEDSTASTVPGEQKPITSRVADTAYGLKNTVASKLGYADQTMSSDSTPVSQKATDSAVQGKDSVASALSSADQGLSSDEKPVSEKAAAGATQVKEGVAEETADPDLQSKGVTGSIMALPGMLSSKLGLGGGDGRPSSAPASSSPTQTGSSLKDSSDGTVVSTPTSGGASFDSSTRKDTPYPDQSATGTAPGIFDRVAGIASSLFSGGAASEPSTTEGETDPFARKSI